ncbi:MAG: RHS repeat-associated core domain-containing protein [Pseudomonadales bacterium]|nr:RHS repeat-associated core domain-containing protein [Pseudomonadales bacterium]MBH2079046.1 RHS repeat-associated core domain-containing protein [Pseudomonadales bacterium]
MSAHTRKTMLLATDQQQSVLNTLDENGPRSIAYTPYGHRSPENGLLSLLGFNGEPPDALTGHYHLGNGYRQFNPVLMRFNSPDSWSPFGEGGVNAYAYCALDPVNKRDLTGHAPTFIRYILKKLGYKNRPSIMEERIATTQKNSLENVNNVYATNEQPTEKQMTLRQLENTRQLDYEKLINNPEKVTGRTRTYTKLNSGKRILTRRFYSDLTLSIMSKTPASPIPARVVKLTFSEVTEIHEFKRIVPEPLKKWREVANIRQTSK